MLKCINYMIHLDLRSFSP